MDRLDKEAAKNIKILRYNTLEELLAAEYGMSMEELKECKHGGYDGNGNEYEMTTEEVIRSIIPMGCYGFARGKTEIHLWVSDSACMEDIICMVAHERGHLMRPFHDNVIQEEMKAELYGLCAQFAYRVTADLIGRDRGKRRDAIAERDRARAVRIGQAMLGEAEDQ